MKDLTTRREALLAAGGAAAAALLAGCGDNPDNGPHTQEVLRTSIALDYASYYAPVHDLTRLIGAAAQRRRLAVTFSDDASGAPAQLASVKRLTGPTGGFRLVVVAPFDPAALQPALAAAHARRITLAGFVTPLAGADVHIGPSPDEAAARLAAQTPPGNGTLLVLPPATSPVPDPFFGYARLAAMELQARVPRSTFQVTVNALGADDAAAAIRALPRLPAIDTILTWNDATALGALAAAPHARFIGALGAPAPTSRHVLEQLQASNPFTVLVATRLATLADDLVTTAAPLLRGTTPSLRPTPLTAFRGGAETRAALADYAS